MMDITQIFGEVLIFIILLPVIAVVVLGSNITGAAAVVFVLVDVILVVAFIVHLMNQTKLKKR